MTLTVYAQKAKPLKVEQEEGSFQGKQRKWFHCIQRTISVNQADCSKEDFLHGIQKQIKNNPGSSQDFCISEEVVKVVQLGS